MKNYLLITAILALSVPIQSKGATVTLVGNGAGSGAIIVTSARTNIDLGTRIRIGTFTDSTALNNAISGFTSGSSTYAATITSLNSIFQDLGTNVTNYGSASQTGTGVSASQVVFNTTASLAINGASAATYNVFNGGIASVTYSSSIGANKNLYLWTAFNNEIGIFRNTDGTGTTAWVTPSSDLSGVTMNLSGINSQAEVLLGSYIDYASGSDLLALQAAIPEPSTGALMMIGAVGLVALRRLRKV